MNSLAHSLARHSRAVPACRQAGSTYIASSLLDRPVRTRSDEVRAEKRNAFSPRSQFRCNKEVPTAYGSMARRCSRINGMDLIRNKKAGLQYEILEELEAGIELYGFEVKSLRAHHGSLEGARVIIRGGEAFLVGAEIPPFQPANAPNDYDPRRTRRLLVGKRDIARLGDLESQRGLTLVPISVYNKKQFIKVRVALVRGKKKYDKRETIKKRDMEMEMKRSLKD